VVARVRLPLQGGTVLFDGEIAPGQGDYATRPLQGHLEVKLDDLGFLRVAGDEIRRVGGRIEGNMDWSGTLQQPRPRGELRLENGELDLATPGIELTELRARIGTETADAADAERLYALLEEQVVPLYYTRTGGIPLGWVDVMRHAMRLAGSRFMARRMVQDYVRSYYVPAMRGDPFSDDPPAA
jgi:hypothetical protein